MKLSRVVIPAAGLGTRFLPITKSIPKEMLPIWDKPAIHYIIKEVFLSDIKNISLIVSKEKNSIADYFDYSLFLDQHQKNQPNVNATLSELDFLINNLNLNYIRQMQPKGLGHAVLMAKNLITDDDFFAVLLPDDIIFANTPVLKQLAIVAKKYQCSVVAVQEVPLDLISSYGVAKVSKKIEDNIFEIEDLVEKPKSNPPSNLAVIGRYILSSKIYSFIESSKIDYKGEIQLTSAISAMAKTSERVLAVKFEGERFDIGSPQGLFQANLKVFNSLNK